MKKILMVTFTILALVFVSCNKTKNTGAEKAADEFKLKMRLAVTTPRGHPYDLASLKYADLIRERTNGRIDISVYADATLAKGEREQIEALQQGTIEMCVTSTGPIGNFSPSMMILDIPFLFRDAAHAHSVLDGPVGRKLLDDLEPVGVKGLVFWESGFRQLTNNKKVIRTPADAKGMKLRTMENRIHMAAFTSAGLNCTPLASAECYSALQQGVVDGQENGIPAIYTSKYYEVQKYLSMTGHVYSPAPILIAKKTWDSIPASDQAILQQTAEEMRTYERQLVIEVEETGLKDMASKGVVITTDVDKPAWVAAMASAFAEFEKEFGKANIDAIMNAN
jgi:tripartite ATP-independent transporter DctP family solute receptor